MLFKGHSAVCTYRINIIAIKYRNTVGLHRSHEILSILDVKGMIDRGVLHNMDDLFASKLH